MSTLRCKELFGKSPASIITTRPETDLRFLEFLKGKEHVLHRLALKDLEQRDLSAATRRAVESLGKISDRVRRGVLAELLQRTMYLLYFNVKHPRVVESSSWDVLVEKAVGIINDLSISDEFLERSSFSRKQLADLGDERPTTWVEVVVLEIVGEFRLVPGYLREALDFHLHVSGTAGSHLNLLGHNTIRTPWLAAKLLLPTASQAKAAAVSLVAQLVTTRPDNRTSFEKLLVDSADLWSNLEEFSKAAPAVCLWHGRGKFETLYKFLAPRFLLAPDHVLDTERIHARWQWYCAQRRNLRLPTLNALLRLQHYLEQRGELPSHELLLDPLLAEHAEHKAALGAVVDEGQVAIGWRFSTRSVAPTMHNIDIHGCEGVRRVL